MFLDLLGGSLITTTGACILPKSQAGGLDNFWLN